MERINTIFQESITNYILKPVLLMALCILILFIVWLAISAMLYKKTTYYDVTHNSFIKMRFNIGNYGEYLIYKCLKTYERKGARFLFNCYMPKDDGETTEADIIMIDKSGIYVFESKNYSGWIFGNEKSKNWTQTLPDGKKSRKESFLNPIMQNKLHIRCLKALIGDEDAIHSIVVFSERCTLKKVEVSEDMNVLKRGDLNKLIKKIAKKNADVLSDARIGEIYDILYPYTQVSDSVKKKHIADIKKY